jgi:hypothetical protein
MFHLSDTQLVALSRWDPVEAGFSREDGWAHGERLSLFVEALRRRHWLGVNVEAEGGLENYAHVFLYDALLFPRHVKSEIAEVIDYEGVSIYLSLLGPYAAIGPTSKYMRYEVTERGRGIGVGASAELAPSDVMSEPGDDTVLQAAFNESKRIGYRILGREELAQPLPGGIEPMDVCGLPDEPYTYFDLLFNETD